MHVPGLKKRRKKSVRDNKSGNCEAKNLKNFRLTKSCGVEISLSEEVTCYFLQIETQKFYSLKLLGLKQNFDFFKFQF